MYLKLAQTRRLGLNITVLVRMVQIRVDTGQEIVREKIHEGQGKVRECYLESGKLRM